jgi:DNA invertase Pin-like site-specific DNA recombinase
MMQFLYARVSTSDQTVAHQLEQARAAGFAIDDDSVIKDEGVSGVATRFAEREGSKRLLDKLRAGDVLVVRWLDRLGRNYEDVVDTIRALMRRGVVIRTVINGMTFDGAHQPDGKGDTGRPDRVHGSAGAGAQAEATKLAQQAGIAYAQANGSRVYLGRKPSYSRQQLDRILDLLATESDITIAKQVGLDRLAVRRIQQDPAKAEGALASWEALKGRPGRRNAVEAA